MGDDALNHNGSPLSWMSRFITSVDVSRRQVMSDDMLFWCQAGAGRWLRWRSRSVPSIISTATAAKMGP